MSNEVSFNFLTYSLGGVSLLGLLLILSISYWLYLVQGENSRPQSQAQNQNGQNGNNGNNGNVHRTGTGWSSSATLNFVLVSFSLTLVIRCVYILTIPTISSLASNYYEWDYESQSFLRKGAMSIRTEHLLSLGSMGGQLTSVLSCVHALIMTMCCTYKIDLSLWGVLIIVETWAITLTSFSILFACGSFHPAQSPLEMFLMNSNTSVTHPLNAATIFSLFMTITSSILTLLLEGRSKKARLAITGLGQRESEDEIGHDNDNNNDDDNESVSDSSSSSESDTTDQIATRAGRQKWLECSLQVALFRMSFYTSILSLANVILCLYAALTPDIYHKVPFRYILTTATSVTPLLIGIGYLHSKKSIRILRNEPFIVQF